MEIKLSNKQWDYLNMLAEETHMPVGNIEQAYHDVLEANFEQDIVDVINQLVEE